MAFVSLSDAIVADELPLLFMAVRVLLREAQVVAVHLIDRDLAWLLRVMLTEESGSNIRNEVAHGWARAHGWRRTGAPGRSNGRPASGGPGMPRIDASS